MLSGQSSRPSASRKLMIVGLIVVVALALGLGLGFGLKPAATEGDTTNETTTTKTACTRLTTLGYRSCTETFFGNLSRLEANKSDDVPNCNGYDVTGCPSYGSPALFYLDERMLNRADGSDPFDSMNSNMSSDCVNNQSPCEIYVESVVEGKVSDIRRLTNTDTQPDWSSDSSRQSESTQTLSGRISGILNAMDPEQLTELGNSITRNIGLSNVLYLGEEGKLMWIVDGETKEKSMELSPLNFPIPNLIFLRLMLHKLSSDGTDEPVIRYDYESVPFDTFHQNFSNDLERLGFQPPPIGKFNVNYMVYNARAANDKITTKMTPECSTLGRVEERPQGTGISLYKNGDFSSDKHPSDTSNDSCMHNGQAYAISDCAYSGIKDPDGSRRWSCFGDV